MSALPGISLITPSFNQARFIRSTLDSVLKQDYPKLEYWVMDGGSTDGTTGILQNVAAMYPSKFKWVSEVDRGQTHALNKGIERTKGEIVGYLNSDDCLLPGVLQTVGEYFAAHPEVQWLTGDCEIIDAEGKQIQGFVRGYKSFWRGFNSMHVLSVLNPIAQPSTFWRRSTMEKAGRFDESLRYCMDYDFWFRLYQQGKPAVLHQALSQFRIHGESKGGSQFTAQFAEEVGVALRFSNSPLLQALHRLHAWATVQAYQLLK
jgi:glycosyltransferase involved in cell wall biosynthesis